MEYNCKDCKEYWDNVPDDFENLEDALFYIPEDQMKYIRLYCPKCKRSEREW